MAKVGDITVTIDTSELSRISKEMRKTMDLVLCGKPPMLYMDTDSFICNIKTSASVENWAETFMKRYRHFTDGGTPKKQVQEDVKIPIDKRDKFGIDLNASTRARKTISDKDFDAAECRWDSGKNWTHCKMSLNGVTYYGIARKHPDDTPNEYIGKSLSFNRAFAKLEDAVNGVGDKACVGHAIHPAFRGGYVNVSSSGRTILCRAGAHIAKGNVVYNGDDGKVYPKKSERLFYHGGIDLACESTCGCIPEGFVIIDDELCKVGRKESVSDDITITMSRKKAVYVADAIAGGFNVSDVHNHLLDAIRR